MVGHYTQVGVEYAEVCKSHNTITDFRAKLLALLPIASGFGLFSLIRDMVQPKEPPIYLLAFGFFGFVIALGLFLHEWRGMKRCDELVALGMSLEIELGQSQGQFQKEYKYYHGPRHPIVGTGTASWIIYSTVLIAWICVFALGTARFFA
jgi:hypothetical protein